MSDNIYAQLGARPIINAAGKLHQHGRVNPCPGSEAGDGGRGKILRGYGRVAGKVR